jgi:hypothetical protein
VVLLVEVVGIGGVEHQPMHAAVELRVLGLLGLDGRRNALVLDLPGGSVIVTAEGPDRGDPHCDSAWAATVREHGVEAEAAEARKPTGPSRMVCN